MNKNLYDRIADLSLKIDSYELQLHQQQTSGDFLRKTTEIVLSGKGVTGRGEDVTYESEEHDALQSLGPQFHLSGEYSLASFSETLDNIYLFFGRDVDRSEFRSYRRWGFESAALDLALKQAELSFADALEEISQPVRFVVSTRLGDPPSGDRLQLLLHSNSELEFKLDPTSDWSDALINEIAGMDAVRIMDFKGLYEGTEVDQPLTLPIKH